VLNKTDWLKFYNKTDEWRIDYRLQGPRYVDQCINNVQKFILKVFKQSSTYQKHKKRVLMTEEEDRAAIDNLFRLRNYYRRKFQRTAINRHRILKNVLNNHIKIALNEGRNKYWSNK